MPLDRISIELTNKCSKGCKFCYNHSNPSGDVLWHVEELVRFVEDCAANGIKAVSFGGGEPLQYDGWSEVLVGLKGKLFRSMTSNGLLMKNRLFDQVIEAAPEKVHLSVHFPDSRPEVERVTRQVTELAEAGIRSGVNLLVRKSELESATKAARYLNEAGVGNERIVYLPMRGEDTPTPKELAKVADDKPFQSMTCLNECRASPRFCSISWDKKVAWCSYTETKRQLVSLTYSGVEMALAGLGLEYCGKVESTPQLFSLA